MDNRCEARINALKEADAVIFAVVTGSSSSLESFPGGDLSSSHNSGTAAAPPKDSSSNNTDGSNNESTDVFDPPGETKLPMSTKSRFEAVAAAKRRAEERKRAVASATETIAVRGDLTSSGAFAPTEYSSTQSAAHRHPSSNRLDWFNLLGVVTNPGFESWHGGDLGTLTSCPSVHGGGSSHSRSRHGLGGRSRHGLSSHGIPISLDHVGSDGTRSSTSASSNTGDTYAATILAAAGLPEWAGYANTTTANATAKLNTMATSLDEFTGWFDHYSRKYLGTVPGIDSGSLMGEGDDSGEVGGAGGIVGGVGVGNGMSSMWEEYEPEFGPNDSPELELDELPSEISDLDLGSVEHFLRVCGMLGMRFEDRGGGFQSQREGHKGGHVKMETEENVADGDGQNKTDEIGPQTSLTTLYGSKNNSDLAESIESVPEIFFSPYFDLTDPLCFESLLVVSDEEVAQIRAKEAELHALADQKVREIEEVARKDAENQSTMPWPTSRRVSVTPTSFGKNPPNQPGTPPAIELETKPTPTDCNVITLRKPETFTSHLDAIELALLDQVRTKSDSFFRETNRFSELQQIVTVSVGELRVLRAELESLRERCVTNVELVPLMDSSREDLRAICHVLEGVDDVVNCKTSIASLISSGDHLGAVEAIQLARSLLIGKPNESDISKTSLESEADNKRSDSLDENDFCRVPRVEDAILLSTSSKAKRLCLGKLRSLSKVGNQLDEYEELVVRNLTDELVETFLSWGSDRSGMADEGNSGFGGIVDFRAPPRLSLLPEQRSKVRGIIQSLRLCRKLSEAGTIYQKKLCELISLTVKTIVTECAADATVNSDGGTDSNRPTKGTMDVVASMSLDQFLDCINMLFEQVQGLVWGAEAVNKFCIDEGIALDDATSSSAANSSNFHAEAGSPSASAAALAAAADLSEKSVSELLRLRREAHSLVSFDGMRQLWDTSLTFTLQLERLSGRKAYGLRSTLLAQAKAFVERKHEANMSTLVAALDSERWVQCDVSSERQAALTRLCSGRAAFSSRKINGLSVENAVLGSPIVVGGREKTTDAEVEGVRFKVVWSCLLLLEMVMNDVACAAHFQTLATNVVGKVSELFRLFNTRSTHLVLGAGSIHSAARLKSINAKHLAMVTQCIGLVLAILPHVRAALMAQLPTKQHTLLNDLDKIRGDYAEHNEKILSKLVSIIGGIVEHSLASKIPQSDFDARAQSEPISDDTDAVVECCPFLDSVITNTRKMHQVLSLTLPPVHLQDVFSRIFAYLDHKVPSLFKNAAFQRKDDDSGRSFTLPVGIEGKVRMIKEIDFMTKTLNSLPGVLPWHFTAVKILEQELDIIGQTSAIVNDHPSSELEIESDEKKEMDADEGQPRTEPIVTTAAMPITSQADERAQINNERVFCLHGGIDGVIQSASTKNKSETNQDVPVNMPLSKNKVPCNGDDIVLSDTTTQNSKCGVPNTSGDNTSNVIMDLK